MNDTTFDIKKLFLWVKDHPDHSNVLPDELGLSYPVPIILHENNSTIVHMAFFHFYMGRINEALYKLTSPRHKTVVRLDGTIVESHSALSPSFGVDWDDSQYIGEYIPDPNMVNEQRIERRKRYFSLYNEILPLYIAKSDSLSDSEKALVSEFKSIFYIISHPPLLPYYKSLNPDFFNWLESQG